MPYTSGADFKVELISSPSGASSIQVQGTAADGAAAVGNPVLVGGADGSGNAQTALVDTSGRWNIVGAAADGAAAVGNPVLVGGQDGTNAQSLFTDATGRLNMVGAAATGAAVAGNPVFVGGVLQATGNALPLQLNAASSDTVSTGIGALHSISQGYVQGATDWERMRSAAAAAGTTGTGLLGTGLLNYDGTNYQLVRSNLEGTLLASAARTTTTSSSDQTNHNARGVRVTLNVTSAGTGSITISIEEKDPISGTYTAILTGAAVTTNSTNVYVVYPGVTETANVDASSPLPRTWRVTSTHNNANSITYSVAFAVVV